MFRLQRFPETFLKTLAAKHTKLELRNRHVWIMLIGGKTKTISTSWKTKSFSCWFSSAKLNMTETETSQAKSECADRAPPSATCCSVYIYRKGLLKRKCIREKWFSLFSFAAELWWGNFSWQKGEKYRVFYLHSEMSFQPQKIFPLTLLRIGIRSFRREKNGELSKWLVSFRLIEILLRNIFY